MSVATITRADVIARARSAIGHRCRYELGHGGMRPQRTVPWDAEGACDCSGFAMWCLGLSRFMDPYWYGTVMIYSDANTGSGIFTRAEWKDALPGDLLVYPDRVGTDGQSHHGHVAVVVEVGGGPLAIVDCGAGNYRRHNDAIWEGPPDHFVTRGIVARYVGLA